MVTYQDWKRQFGLAGFLTVIGATILVTFPENRTFAQITPDATLGAESSVVKPNTAVRGLPAELIEGGALRGTNLFHSFQEFNVGNGQRVYFANPTGIENILSRITGNNLSNILGTLGVNGSANLFLINPNGIIFGQNARLDIAGSFVASTANSFVFENGLQFSATNPQAPPILTIKVTPGLQYGLNQPKATIANAGSLAVGQNLTLAAGNLDLQGQLQAGKDLTLQAQDTVKVRDSVVNPFIAAAGGKLLVQGNQIVDIFALNHPNSGFFSGGDMVLRSPDAVMGDAHYWSGGNFRIENLDGSLGNLESPNDPIIRASGDVNFNTYQGTSLHILAGGSVTINSVTITGGDQTGNAIVEDVTLSNGTLRSIRGITQPTLDVRAGTTAFGNPGITGTNYTTLFPIPNTNAPATGANITINEIGINQGNGLVFLTNQYQPNTATGNIQVRRIRTGADGRFQFPGNGGEIVMDSRGDIIIPQSIPPFNSTTIRTNSSNGNAGDITLIADGSFIMTGGGQVAAPSFGQGDAGNINIFVRDSVLLNNGAQLGTVSRTPGDAGNINIVAGNAVSFTGGSFVSADVQSTTGGTAGNINIQAGSLSIDNSALQATTEGQENAGSITIDVNRLDLTRGGLVFTGSSGTGKAGDISITATDTVNVNQAFAITGSTGAGDSGNLIIRTGQLNVGGGGQLSTVSAAQGNAGDILITATDSVNVSNQGFVNTGTGKLSTGESGNLSIGTGKLNLSGGGQVTTASLGAGKAGDLLITATESVNVNSQGIIATSSTSTGDSGNLSINTKLFNLSDPGSVVGTNSFGTGKAGDLSITNADTVTISNQGLLSTGSQRSGNGGNLSISTRQLDVINSGIDGGISTIAIGTGNSGNLSILATESMNVVGGGNVITSSDQGTGIAGRIDITTNRLSVRDGSRVVSSTIGAGDAGDVNIRATDSIEVVNLSKLSADTFGSGNAGDLNIETGKLSIQYSEVSTGTFENSSGQGGNLSIKASNVELIGGSIATGARGQSEGGDVRLQANSLNLNNGGSISSSSEGKGKAGDIFINLSDRLTSNRGIIAATSAKAGGGDINITANDIRLSDSSVISSSVFDSTGGGGNITLNSTIFIALDDSDILANADAGPGGNIKINSPGFVANLFTQGQAVAVGRNPGDLARFRSNGQVDISDDFVVFAGNSRTDISTASVSNISGSIIIPDLISGRGLAQLPSNVVDASGLIDRRCSPKSDAQRSSFTVTGRGGLPPNPNQPLMGESVITNWVTLDSKEENSNDAATNTNPASATPKQLIEAQAWVISPDGQVILTAQANTVTSHTHWLNLPSCQDIQTINEGLTFLD